MTKEIILSMLKERIPIDSITLVDYSEYKRDKCNNDGCYIYYETYTKMGGFSWRRKTYRSSTGLDLDYCPYCGNYDGTFEYVPTGDLISILENYKVDEKHSIEICLQEK